LKYYAYVPSTDYRIISTDYANYSVIYACSEVPFGFMSTENVWVMSRTHQLGEEFIETIADVITEKIPLYDFMTETNMAVQGVLHCPYSTMPDEPTSNPFNPFGDPADPDAPYSPIDNCYYKDEPWNNPWTDYFDYESQCDDRGTVEHVGDKVVKPVDEDEEPVQEEAEVVQGETTQ